MSLYYNSGRMTLTINSEIYANLLAKYLPQVIKTDEENERVITLAEEIAHCPKKQPNNLLYLSF